MPERAPMDGRLEPLRESAGAELVDRVEGHVEARGHAPRRARPGERNVAVVVEEFVLKNSLVIVTYTYVL